MANTLINDTIEKSITDGLNWVGAKHKIYVLDKAAYGNAVLISTVGSTASSANPTANGLADVTMTTLAAHGLAVGDRVSIHGLNAAAMPDWVANTAHAIGNWYKRPSRTLYTYAGGTSGSGLDNGATGFQSSGTVLYKNMPSSIVHPNNGIHVVKAVPSTTTFTFFGHPPAKVGAHSGPAHVIKLNRPFLANWNPTIIYTTPALTGKVVRPGGVLSADGISVDLGASTASNSIMLLVKVANLDADVDLITAQQEVIAFWDDTQGIQTNTLTGASVVLVNNFIYL